MSTVLVVDANRKRRAAVREALARRDVQTKEIADGYAGLAAIGRNTYDAVVICEGKRSLSVTSLCDLALRRHPNVPVFLILRRAERAEIVRARLGPRVLLVPPEWGVEQLATRVARNSIEPPAELADVPLPEGPVVLEGGFEEEAGPALLIGLFVQELSGQLVIRDGAGERTSTIFFRKGEPVWAEPVGGDATVFRRLVQKECVPRDLQPQSVPEGELLLSLVRRGTVTDQDVATVMLNILRDAVLAVAQCQVGAYRFEEMPSYADGDGPGLRVNPFGLIFIANKKRLTPQELMRIGADMAPKQIFPGPGLDVATEKIRPFLRGMSANEVIDGSTTVEAFCQRVGLDSVMGSILVQSLVEARLASVVL